jgi:hypothetical protein
LHGEIKAKLAELDPNWQRTTGLQQEYLVLEAYDMCQNLSVVTQIFGNDIPPVDPANWRERLRYLRGRWFENSKFELIIKYLDALKDPNQKIVNPDRIARALKTLNEIRFGEAADKPTVKVKGGTMKEVQEVRDKLVAIGGGEDDTGT